MPLHQITGVFPHLRPGKKTMVPVAPLSGVLSANGRDALHPKLMKIMKEGDFYAYRENGVGQLVRIEGNAFTYRIVVDSTVEPTEDCYDWEWTGSQYFMTWEDSEYLSPEEAQKRILAAAERRYQAERLIFHCPGCGRSLWVLKDYDDYVCPDCRR